MTEIKTTLARVVEIVTMYQPEPSVPVDPSKSPTQLGMDRLDLIGAAMTIEDEFAVILLESDLERLAGQPLTELAALVELRRGQP